MDLQPLLLALACDVFLGEPPARLHPVVWMGRALDGLEARAPHADAARLAYGSGVALGLPLVWGVVGWSLERLMPWPVQALALKATFAGRALLQAARRVELALGADDLGAARDHLRWLVSRPTAELDDGLVASATIESLAENFVDSWVGPLLAYAVFGLGGAYAYRAVNTADAMWGYHDAHYEWLGKAIARLDDALNWLPARLGAGLLLAIGSRGAGDVSSCPRAIGTCPPAVGYWRRAVGTWRRAVATWRRDAELTASPNAGQPMAAAAGLLDVRLEKPGHYILNASARPPTPNDMAAARRLITIAMFASAALAILVRRAMHA